MKTKTMHKKFKVWLVKHRSVMQYTVYNRKHCFYTKCQIVIDCSFFSLVKKLDEKLTSQQCTLISHQFQFWVVLCYMSLFIFRYLHDYFIKIQKFSIVNNVWRSNSHHLSAQLPQLSISVLLHKCPKCIMEKCHWWKQV